jgi:hypothetical protein
MMVRDRLTGYLIVPIIFPPHLPKGLAVNIIVGAQLIKFSIAPRPCNVKVGLLIE